jgi:hypothetical protein
MKEFKPEDLAKLTILGECIHEVLFPYKDFLRFDIKRAYNSIEKSLNHILRHSYGNQSLEELDEYRDKVCTFMDEVVKNNFQFIKKS